MSAYRDGGRIIEKVKKRRQERSDLQPPKLLEDTIGQAPDAIERELSRGTQRFGNAFEEGDHVAILALQRITIEIQSGLLEQLRKAAYDDEVIDFMAQVDAADTGRDRTISTLLDLRQRLLQAVSGGEGSQTTNGTRNRGVSASGSIPQVPQGSGLAPQQAADLAPPHRQFLKHRRTLTPEIAGSGYASNADDTASGAEDTQKKLASKHRNKSLFGFLGHHRSHSSEQIPKSQPEAQAEETSTVSANTAYQPPKQCDIRDDSTSTRSGSTSVRSGSLAEPKFTYEEGDSVADMWNSRKPAGLERRDTHVAPDNMTGISRQQTYVSIAPSNSNTSVMTRTFSNTGSIVPAGYSQASIGAAHPSTENNFLGFCKGAVKLQNGDRKGLNKCRDYMYSAQSGVYYLACSVSKCAFAGKYNPNIIWDKVWVDNAKGLKFRWPFLAKSHVLQKTVKQDQYAYQCLFCVYLGNATPVMHGMELYFEHISQDHRGHAISDVILYKVGAIHDREAADSEEFDINLFPLSVEEFSRRKESNALLNDDLIQPDLKRSDTIAKDSMFSNEPWNEGLSDFHYGGNSEFDYTSMYDRDFHTAELEG